MWRDSLPSEVIEKALYLGNAAHGSTAATIHALEITHVVNITLTRYTEKLLEGGASVKELFCRLEDRPTENISQFFAAANQFIGDGLKTGRVLVHCEEGVSRSPTLVMAYLLLSHQLSLQQAIIYVRLKRPFINPNNGFMRQLIQLEKSLHSTTSVNESDFSDDWGAGVLFVKIPASMPEALKIQRFQLEAPTVPDASKGEEQEELPV